MRREQTSFPEECVRFPYPSGGHKSRQNVLPAPECLPVAPATVAAGPEIHSDDSRDRCETRSASPFQPNFCELQLPGERLLGESVRCPSARIPAPAGHAAVLAAMATECLPPRPGTASPCQLIRNARSFARWHPQKRLSHGHKARLPVDQPE